MTQPSPMTGMSSGTSIHSRIFARTKIPAVNGSQRVPIMRQGSRMAAFPSISAKNFWLPVLGLATWWDRAWAQCGFASVRSAGSTYGSGPIRLSRKRQTIRKIPIMARSGAAARRHRAIFIGRPRIGSCRSRASRCADSAAALTVPQMSGRCSPPPDPTLGACLVEGGVTRLPRANSAKFSQ
jgi:hypothetical protein